MRYRKPFAAPQARAARPLQSIEASLSPGLKIKALRRFDMDGCLEIGLKTAIFARIDGKSMQSRQNGVPVRTSWPDIHLFYKHSEDGVERNIPGRQMGIADFSASDLCSLF